MHGAVPLSPGRVYVMVVNQAQASVCFIFKQFCRPPLMSVNLPVLSYVYDLNGLGYCVLELYDYYISDAILTAKVTCYRTAR
jgi:hypothetical protein